jgi:hypothetical protein
METIAAVLLAVVGLVNFVPIVGMRSARTLSKMYGITVRAGDVDLAILLRHRAAMLGLVGGFLVYAAFVPSLQPIAFVIGFLSMLSFVLFARSTPRPNRAVRRVAAIDVGASVLLASALLLRQLA